MKKYVCVVALVTAAACGGRARTVSDALERYLTESADVDRYFAYCNAALGRPYQSFYVRSAAEWRDEFARARTLDRMADDEGVRQRSVVNPARPLLPFRDFLVEYPPGFFLVALPAAVVSRDVRTYVIVFSLSMVAALVAAAILCTRIAVHAGRPVSARRLLLLTIAGVVALGAVVMQRYDAAVSFLLCAMCWAAITRRPAVLGVSTGAAVAIKLIPIVPAAMCALYVISERRVREIKIAAAVAALTALAICGPVIIAAPEGSLDVVRYHRDRPLEFGSTGAALVGLWHAVDPAAVSLEHSFGSSNIVGRFSGAALFASNLLTVAGAAFVFMWAWRRLASEATASARARTLVAAVSVALAAFIVTSKVASPQYFVWLLPLGVLVSLFDGGATMTALLIAAMLLAQIVYPVIAPDVEALRPWALALVLCRNATLATWAILIAARSSD